MEPFLEIADNRGRRPRFLLSAWVWILILLLVLFAAFKVIPLGPAGIFSSRQAAKMLAEARRWEDQSLYISAAELYEQISNNTKIKPQLRVRAALRLAALNNGQLANPRAAEAAIEKAYYFSPPGPDRDALRDRLEALRGRPLEQKESPPPSTLKSPSAPETAAAPSADPILPLPKGAHVIARAGGEEATLEEILFAWSQFNSNTAPTAEMLKPFVKWYLDMVLLADEARRRGLDRQSRVALDLRVKRILGMNQALTQQIIENLKPPKLEALKDYYKANQAAFTHPARVTIGHLVVNKAEDVRAVEKALSKGEKIEKLARQYSLDARQLKDGFTIGPISVGEAAIPRVGTVPGLARKLMTYADGTTTGPIRIQDSAHWIKVLGKTPPKLEPFENVREETLMSFQKQQVARLREEMLKDLHQRTAITIFDDKLKADLFPAAPPASARAALPTTGTTATKAVTASPAADSETSSRTTSPAAPGPAPDVQDKSKDED